MKKITLLLIILIMLITNLIYINNNKNIEVYSNLNEDILEIRESNTSLKIMTYNIQHGVGMDNRLNLNRISRVINKGGAGIIGLNEVDKRMPRSLFINQAKKIAGDLNMTYVFGPTFKLGLSSYGNALLTVYPVLEVDNIILPGNGREPRGLLEARLLIPGFGEMLVLTTHLSLQEEARRSEINFLLNYLENLNEAAILLGDFNTELKGMGNFTALSYQEKTYPANRPGTGIDMIFVNFPADYELYTIMSDGSDHLPLFMNIDIRDLI